MPPADASPAATDRPEPSGANVREGVTVPPPRSAPESTTPATPGSPLPGGPAGPAATGPAIPGPATPCHDASGHDAPEPVTVALAESADGADDAGTAGPVAATAAGLTERELRILAFEQQWWRHAGAKEQAIRDAFGVSATRYYQLLNGLLDNPAALAAEPLLVGRLRRLRSSRARNRRR
ncbi:DUF3263 domain-containing protein [Micromonospora rubida]|uniref:DUF3263 domain-containing protein n=1 Tax=Micromonospora rubida TaxID=2697657 RepID=UPI001F38A983|nr:DUF3263 domain-containing protein [Micromonospora rubida]